VSTPWAAVVVEVPAEEAEELAGWLGLGSLGVEVLPAETHDSRLVRVYTEAHDAEPTLARARELLRARGLAAASGGAALEPVDDGRWVERYQRGLSPFPLGERFLIVPGERPADDPARTGIRLVPGRAFGTGEHPTTRLCVEALEREVSPGERWLDLGTGSGILAVVAAHCGASAVLALDVDPEAAAVAREVVEANGVGERVTVKVGGIERREGPVDGAVANIAASYFAGRAPALSAALAPGGVLIASGFRQEDKSAVRRALAGAGLGGEAESTLDGWVALTFRKATR